MVYRDIKKKYNQSLHTSEKNTTLEGNFGRQFGRQFWKTILENNFGRQFWKTILEDNFGRHFWKTILEKNFGRQFWKTILEVYSGNVFYHINSSRTLKVQSVNWES